MAPFSIEEAHTGPIPWATLYFSVFHSFILSFCPSVHQSYFQVFPPSFQHCSVSKHAFMSYELKIWNWARNCISTWQTCRKKGPTYDPWGTPPQKSFTYPVLATKPNSFQPCSHLIYSLHPCNYKRKVIVDIIRLSGGVNDLIQEAN